jgi:hypothetical protein
VLPAEGPSTKQTVGNALINGKLRLAGLASPATDGNTRNELYLWHYFGDPSMSMWGGDPPVIWDPARFNAVYEAYSGPSIPDPPPYEVKVTLPAELNGRPIALLRGGEVIGKGTAGNGIGIVRAEFGDGSPKPGELQVAVEPADGPPVKVPVGGVPEPAPPPPTGPADTTLTQTCPADARFPDDATLRGRLSPAFAGAQIKVTWTKPGGRGSFDHTVPTDAQGNFSDTIHPQTEDPNNGGTWHVVSSYAGDAGHKAASGEPCAFEAINDG